MKTTLSPSFFASRFISAILTARRLGFFVNTMKRKIIPSKVKKTIWSKACVICGLSGLTQVDHIIPIANGGMNDIENLQPLCKQCNNKKNCHKSNDDLIDCYLENREAHIRKHAWYLSMVNRNHWDGPVKAVYDSFLTRSMKEAF
jgi:5-methylcytosine-specific restriction protein A